MTDATIDWEALSASFECEYAAAWQGIVDRSRAGNVDRTAPLRTGWGGELIVNTLGYGVTDVDALLAGQVEPVTAVLTQDGGSFINEWDLGDEVPGIDDWVYYERWTPEGRVAHGYLNPITRRITQTG